MRSSLLAAIAAASLITASSAAVAQTAAPAAPAAPVERAGASVDGGSELQGTTLWVAAAIALALLIWGLIELLGDDEEEAPVSP
jgi:hypothetical protein